MALKEKKTYFDPWTCLKAWLSSSEVNAGKHSWIQICAPKSMSRCMSYSLYFPAPQNYTKDLYTPDCIQLFKTQTKIFCNMNIEDLAV